MTELPNTVPTRACPKCGHLRGPIESAPAWQCPSCGIAYHKYREYLGRAKASLAPRQSRDGAAPLPADTSMWALVGVNVVALVVAIALDWRLVDLMAVYWIQSVIIGGSYFARIRGLERFSTENFEINNRPVEPTEATKRQVAGFFALHFGAFHIAYLFFIFAETDGFDADLGLLVCAGAFLLNHVYSYRYHSELDRQGTPNIGTLMFTPYLRIVPMHLTIVFGAATMATGGLLIFGVLKTIADVVMHLVEHRVLAKHAEEG